MIISLIWTLSILHYLSSIDHTLKCINDNLILILSKWSERPMLSNLYADLSQFLYSSSFQSFKAAIALCSVIQLCLTLCDPMEYSWPGSSVHGIFQARILAWVAISSSRGSSQGLKLCLLQFLHWQADSLPMSPWGIPSTYYSKILTLVFIKVTAHFHCTCILQA